MAVRHLTGDRLSSTVSPNMSPPRTQVEICWAPSRYPRADRAVSPLRASRAHVVLDQYARRNLERFDSCQNELAARLS